MEYKNGRNVVSESWCGAVACRHGRSRLRLNVNVWRPTRPPSTWAAPVFHERGLRRLVRLSSTLLPVAHSADRNVEPLRELGLRQAKLQRRRLTGDTRLILASYRLVKGCASGSDNAAARTPSSVIASNLVQSVAVRRLTFFLMVPASLLSRRFARGDDSCVAASQGVLTNRIRPGPFLAFRLRPEER